MKKVKYRNNQNNYNNQIYSINYKFDSISPAGKFSGTALDLIKRYNELAKEAHGNGSYVEAEVFRQYAEHYRKIVTEINERKNPRFPIKEQGSEDSTTQNMEQATSQVATEKDMNIKEEPVAPEEGATFVETKPKAVKKAFTVIEVTDETASSKKNYHRRKKNAAEEAANA